MAVTREPIAKKCRKFDISPAVMGYGNKKSTRNPGGNRRKKVSEYGAQLQEKQKVKFVYGVQEKQFHKYYLKAANMKGITGDNMLRLLELRLDNVVFRLGLAKTRRAARQIVCHGHIRVNDMKVDIPSYQVKVGDKITLRKRSEESELFNFDFASYFDADEDVVVYPLETIDDVIRFDIMLMLVNKIKFKPCKCCGEYFIPRGRINSEYCERIMPGETKPCSEIGALKTFDIVHKDDAIHKAYITAYRRMDSRQRAKLITKEEFKEFGKTARAERKKCYNGEITLEQFQTWLDDFR